jgi:hypothetical protein
MKKKILWNTDLSRKRQRKYNVGTYNNRLVKAPSTWRGKYKFIVIHLWYISTGRPSVCLI